MSVLVPPVPLGANALARDRVRLVRALCSAGLSDDAVPTLVSRLPTLRDPTLRAQLAARLAHRRVPEGDWRSWNLSRSDARAALSSR